MSDKIKSIKQWFELAKPEPTIEDACVQIGCHYEEVAEMIDSLFDANDLSVEYYAAEYKDKLEEHTRSIEFMNDQERECLLDALCDQIVTAVGVAHMMGMDIEGALNEVNRSNYSKFENGKPVFNEQGKIAKGKDYTPPKLDKFI